jgi:hypothetical protein
MQFLYAGLLSFAGGLLAVTGCSDITAGQPTDPTGPPLLVHVLIQDGVPAGGPPAQRTSITDLLDTQDTNPDLKCSDIQPCLVQFVEAFTAPNFSCSCATIPTTNRNLFLCGKDASGNYNTGTCNDPLKLPSGGIPLFGDPGATPPPPGDAAAGMQIRIVFSKLLNNMIEAVTPNGSTTPGMTLTYTLADIIELDGPNGKLDASALWDPTGTPALGKPPVTPSDPEQLEIGPAIVLKPSGNLAPLTTYTVTLHTAMLKDRTGNAAADANGHPLPDPYTIQFTTEDISYRSGVSNPAGSFASTCQSASDCPSSSVCVPAGICEAKCMTDLDCASGQTCTSSLCVTPACMTDMDCGTGQVCGSGGICQATIKPNEIFSVAFWATMDRNTITNLNWTGPTGFDPTKVEIFVSQGVGNGAGDPMKNPTDKCKKIDPANPPKIVPSQAVMMVYTTAPGMPTDWPAGTYTLSFTIQDAPANASAKPKSSFDTKTIANPLTFIVKGKDADVTMDGNTAYVDLKSVGQILPEQCTGTK